jgi:thiol-disulfide isomerase/thioredoxin
VLVRPDGTIGSPVAGGAGEIRRLLGEIANIELPEPVGAGTVENGAASGDDAPEHASVGEPAPDVSLPNLAGATVRLSDFHGHPTLVLFWSPSCGFCQRMLPDLKAWEAASPRKAPRLLVVSSGTVEDNESMGLRSPVVLDQGFRTGSMFGANGTPSAVLVDAEGRIASGVAVGADAVLTLARKGGAKARTAVA